MNSTHNKPEPKDHTRTAEAKRLAIQRKQDREWRIDPQAQREWIIFCAYGLIDELNAIRKEARR